VARVANVASVANVAMATATISAVARVAHRSHSRPMEVPAARRLRMLNRPEAWKVITTFQKKQMHKDPKQSIM